MVDMEVNTLTKAIFAKVQRTLLQEATAERQAEAVTGGPTMNLIVLPNIKTWTFFV